MGFFDLFRSSSLKESSSKNKDHPSGAGGGYTRQWGSSVRKVTDQIHKARHRLAEQAGFPFDNVDAGTPEDDRLYQRVDGQGPYDLPADRTQTAQRLCFQSWMRNPRAFRSVEMLKDFALGDGLRFSAADPKVKSVLDLHWKMNEWDQMLGDRVRTIGIFGEQLYVPFVREGDGLVIIGSINPMHIYSILTNPHNQAELIRVFTTLRYQDRVDDHAHQHRRNGDGKDHVADHGFPEGRSFPIIRLGPDGKLTYVGDEKDPDVFFFAVNRIDGARRGMPDLLPSLDWLEGLDGFVFSMMERADLASNVVFDIMYKGFKDSEIKKRIDQFNQQMRDGLTYGHNENVELTIKSPQLGGADAEIVNRIIIKQVQAGTGFAGLFFGDSDDLTRASASELSVPVAKMIQSRQQFIKHMMTRIFQFQIERSVAAGALKGVTDFSFEITMPKVFLRDLTTVTKSILDLSEALGVGVDKGWIDNDQAGAMFKVSLEQLGKISEAQPEAQPQESSSQSEDHDLSAARKET